MIVGGAFLTAISSIFRFIGHTRTGYTYALIGNMFGGLGQSFLMFIPPTLAATWFGESERARASALGVLMNMFGAGLGFLMGTMFVHRSSDYEHVKQGRISFVANFVQILLSQAPNIQAEPVLYPFPKHSNISIT